MENTAKKKSLEDEALKQLFGEGSVHEERGGTLEGKQEDAEGA